jgi:hypothetical protein
MNREHLTQTLMAQANKNRDRLRTEHAHPCCKVWKGTDGKTRRGHFGPNLGYTLGQYVDEENAKAYTCPRGHSFNSKSPIIVAVDGDPEYNTGPICGYCYVDWFKANLNANEVTEDT